MLIIEVGISKLYYIENEIYCLQQLIPFTARTKLSTEFVTWLLWSTVMLSSPTSSKVTPLSYYYNHFQLRYCIFLSF